MKDNKNNKIPLICYYLNLIENKKYFKIISDSLTPFSVYE